MPIASIQTLSHVSEESNHGGVTEGGSLCAVGALAIRSQSGSHFTGGGRWNKGCSGGYGV